MVAFTSHFAEPCYTQRLDPNSQLKLLVEQIARDTERSFSKMDLLIQSIDPPDPSFLHEMEEAGQRSAKQIEWVKQVRAQLAKDHLFATIKEEEEDEEAIRTLWSR
ncbi:unnamed protein product [Linum trigynum]|uniref:Uncharacterized protein n=1 Tax=Linum trigynum TaxID=586398 RepID=A0AAV2EW48_9ROSI